MEEEFTQAFIRIDRDAARWLLGVMNDRSAKIADRINAARCLLKNNWNVREIPEIHDHPRPKVVPEVVELSPADLSDLPSTDAQDKETWGRIDYALEQLGVMAEKIRAEKGRQLYERERLRAWHLGTRNKFKYSYTGGGRTITQKIALAASELPTKRIGKELKNSPYFEPLGFQNPYSD